MKLAIPDDLFNESEQTKRLKPIFTSQIVKHIAKGSYVKAHHLLDEQLQRLGIVSHFFESYIYLCLAKEEVVQPSPAKEEEYYSLNLATAFRLYSICLDHLHQCHQQSLVSEHIDMVKSNLVRVVERILKPVPVKDREALMSRMGISLVDRDWMLPVVNKEGMLIELGGEEEPQPSANNSDERGGVRLEKSRNLMDLVGLNFRGSPDEKSLVEETLSLNEKMSRKRKQKKRHWKPKFAKGTSTRMPSVAKEKGPQTGKGKGRRWRPRRANND
ncbi:hypothetical protein BJ508DRAFT_323327 [Ascobolus immersus RN42]|uniref:Uncharacterized protein n=1 Tax=Ascobolus immersus RN42 TaxID=1160509 RepID=A0A3N4IH64_ASCIM|nr:hypothetical protein BJ508DRAFT_323327 [Ascobolus immersus RN42]